MRPIYQVTGALPGTNGDCFQACLASVFDLSLKEVPNFMEGSQNGKLLPVEKKKELNEWLATYRCRYLELGYNTTLDWLLPQMAAEMEDHHYLLTGRNKSYHIHTVVCRGKIVIHDPATNPGTNTIYGACHDGFYRIGIFPLVL